MADDSDFTARPSSRPSQPVRGIRLAPGARVGRCEIVRFLSEGGIAAVYVARDPAVPRTVALKVIARDPDDDAHVRARFQREVRAAAQLSHPGIVRLFDVGEEEGFWFYTMEYIDGPSLHEVLKRAGRLPVKVAMRVAFDVARALGHAHEKGVIHRDIKPGNILIATESPPSDRPESPEAIPVGGGFVGRYHAVITDFGLARDVRSTTALTLSGDVLGTPKYMSPEAASGQTSQADARSDVYSLGAVLYEMLTGRGPAEGATTLEVLESVKSKEPPSPRTLVPDLSRDVEAVTMRALYKVRERRYAHGGEMAEDIHRHLRGEAVRARAPSTVYRMRQAIQRRLGPVGMWTSLIAVAALGLGGWLTTALVSRSRDARHYSEASGVWDRVRPVRERTVQYLRRGDRARAEASVEVLRGAMREAQGHHTRFVEGWHEIARVERLLGRPDAAEESLRRCLDVEPDNPWALADIGMVACMRYRRQIEQSWFRSVQRGEAEAASTDPESERLRQEAVAWLERAQAAQGQMRDDVLEAAMAWLDFLSDRPAEARSRVEDLYQEDALLLKGRLLLQERRWPEALEAYGDLITLNRGFVEAWEGRAILHRLRAHLAEEELERDESLRASIADWTELVAQGAGREEALYWRAEARFQLSLTAESPQEELALASADLDAALRGAGGHEVIHLLRIEVEWERAALAVDEDRNPAEHFAAAEESLRAMEGWMHRDPGLARTASDLLREYGAWRESQQLSPTAQFREAAEILQALAEAQPDDWTTWVDLGETYDAMQRYPDAAAAYERALDIRPDDLDIQVRLRLARARAGNP